MSGNGANINHTDQAYSDVPPPTLLWQNHLLGAPFVHTPQQQQQLQQQLQQQQQQQQQHYNEIIYNMHADAYGTPAGHPEIYSVLPLSHGNFLKVYHCQENAENFIHQQQQTPMQQFQLHQQPQHLPAYHLPPAQSPTQPLSPIFNSYELFSSNTLMPPPENSIPSLSPTDLGRGPLLLNNVNAIQEEVPNAAHANVHVNATTANSNKNTNATNTIIHKLVKNWSPNLTGNTYTPFGAAVPQLQSEHGGVHSESPQATTLPEINIKQNNINMQAASPSPLVMAPTLRSEASQLLPEKQIQRDYQRESSVMSNKTLSAVPIATASSVPEVKKRIVAEVKPMRMTYSDVLSKLNNQQESTPLPSLNAKHTVGGKASKITATVTAAQQMPNDRRVESGGKSSSETPARRQTANARDDDVEKLNLKAAKRSSPIHQENKENVQHIGVNNKHIKRGSNNNNISGQGKLSGKPTKSGIETNNKKRSSNNGNNNNNNNNKRNENETQPDKKTAPTVEKDYQAFYNVAAAKNNDNYERPMKSSTNGNTSNANLRRSNKSSGSSSNTASNHQKSRSNNAAASNYTTSTAASSSNNNNSSSSYSYSSKRNRGGGYSIFASATTVASNRNYELAQRLLRTWAEFALKVLNWLFYLIYDIVVLGCSMVYERLTQAYDFSVVYVGQLRHELQQNSHKPSLWIRQQWRRFDTCFKKDSVWAFWRRFYKKKPTESSTDGIKTGSGGRLPQTGEEAMYSLLNCKGKDAYSILGVPHDSPQEQIRKHYKKIAVLVHPDKNKQAGAEEAFKVLQRAFELIGEPENRLAYNQSLAEALHAEKAWTELHDLLSQLQTKITEAANTIRCSTCGQRHPRKLTGRPHYAARECASCKIRHSAREGDIWAETSFLGLRWKYLALMEGKVYDITEWANCQKGALSHLESNSHLVQYRIVRGAQQQQQQQQQQQHQTQTQPQQGKHQNHSSPHGSGSKYKQRDVPPSEASLHDFLDNLYSGQHPNNSQAGNFSAFSSSARRRSRRN